MRRFAAATMPMMAYGFALIAPACATAISLLFPSFFAANPFTPFYLAAALAAWYGGLGAGLTSVVAGTLAAGYVSLPPRGHFVFNTPGILHLLLFIAVACAITGLIATTWRRREAPTRRASDRAPEADRWEESEQGERNAVARGLPIRLFDLRTHLTVATLAAAQLRRHQVSTIAAARLCAYAIRAHAQMLDDITALEAELAGDDETHNATS